MAASPENFRTLCGDGGHGTEPRGSTESQPGGEWEVARGRQVEGVDEAPVFWAQQLASATFIEIQTGEPSYSALRKTTIPIYVDKSPLFSSTHSFFTAIQCPEKISLSPRLTTARCECNYKK